MTTKFSIIIPSFNSGSTILRCINSVLNQTFSNFEILVIDNNSSDDTLEIIRSIKDPRIKVYSINNQGIVAKSRNLGLQRASSNFICFLDSDDWWHKNKLDIVKCFLDKGYQFLYHDMYIVSSKSNKTSKTFGSKNLGKDPLETFYLYGNQIVNSSVVVEKELITDAGFLDENPNLSGCEDFDLWLKIFLKKIRYKKIPHILGYYLQDGNNFSNPQRSHQNSQELKKMFLIIKKNLKKKEDPIWLVYKENKALFDLKKYTEITVNYLSCFNFKNLYLSLKLLFVLLASKLLGLSFRK